MAKSSRKGKKAWRKNIDTSEVERAAAEKSRAERLGTDVDVLPDADLFFIDKERRDPPVKPAERRKAARVKGQKVLRSQAILQAAHTARPVVMPRVATKGKPPAAAGQADVTKDVAIRGAQGASRVYDLWADLQPAGAAKQDAEADFDDLAQALAAKKRTPYGAIRPAKRRKAALPRVIAPVEVDAPGCSYNPDREQHQEAVARAVAEENAKLISAELQAKPPPKHVDWQPETDPMMAFQADAVWDEEDEEEVAEADEGEGAQRFRQKGKKTRAERNRQARGKEAAAELADRQRLKRHRTELHNLKGIQAEVAAMEAERERRAQRRATIRAEKALIQPPRLGKLRFQDQPLQVLLSEDVNGSLRRLKASPMLAKERFSSLQKRGIIEPRLPAGVQKRRRRKTYTTGERGESTREGHAAMLGEPVKKAGKR